MNKYPAMRILVFAGLAVALFSPSAQADDRWFHHHHDRPYYWREARRPSLAVGIFVGGIPYDYCEGSFYRHGPRGYVIVPAPVGAVVTTLPSGCRTVIINGVVYKVYDGAYYQSVPGGYAVVPAAPAAAAPTVALQTIVVNVPNKNGSYTPVKLQPASNGTYIGPQGEVYPNQPTMEQLKQMYGQ